MTWKNTPPPKDRPILRWHKTWRCPVAVYYKKQTSGLEEVWTEKTLTTCWIELSFNEWWCDYTSPEEG